MTSLLEDMAAFMGGPVDDSVPMPEMPAVSDALARPCWCGAAAVAMVYRWRPDGMSVFEARCRDHKDVGDPLKEGTP